MRSAPKMPGEFWTPLSKGRLGQLASVPICAYVGYNGMGKSALAASIAMAHAEAGRPVLGTARLLDWRNPRPCEDTSCAWPSHGEPGHLQAHPMWSPLTDYRQLFTFRDGHVWADEATGLADARNHQSMPGEVADFLPRMRARQVTFHWTTIHWSFADTRLRRVTWAAAWAAAFMPKYYGDEIWGRNRLFFFRLYDARNLPDDHDPAKRDSKGRPASEQKSMVRGTTWGPRWSAFSFYDTLDGVSSLGGSDESGMCMLCGGARGRKKCPGHGPDGEPLVPARGRRRGLGTDSDHDHATTLDGSELGVHDDPRQGVPITEDDRGRSVPDGPPVEVRRTRRPRDGTVAGPRVRGTDEAGLRGVPVGPLGPVRDGADREV